MRRLISHALLPLAMVTGLASLRRRGCRRLRAASLWRAHRRDRAEPDRPAGRDSRRGGRDRPRVARAARAGPGQARPAIHRRPGRKDLGAQPGRASDATPVPGHQQQDHAAHSRLRRARPVAPRLPPRLRTTGASSSTTPRRCALVHRPATTTRSRSPRTVRRAASRSAQRRIGAHHPAGRPSAVQPQQLHGRLRPTVPLHLHRPRRRRRRRRTRPRRALVRRQRGGNGQDITSNLLGNILRIDVDHARRTRSRRTTRSSTRQASTRSGPTASATRTDSPSTWAATMCCSHRTPSRSSGKRSASSSGAAITAGTSKKAPTASTPATPTCRRLPVRAWTRQPASRCAIRHRVRQLWQPGGLAFTVVAVRLPRPRRA